MFKSLLTWWNGAAVSARSMIAKRAVFVGEDATGNRYFEAKAIIDGDADRRRRYVIYRGYADASKVPADWHGWLHHTFVDPPTVAPFKIKSWERDHLPNLTGTPYAWRPKGSILRRGERAHAVGDYQAWIPQDRPAGE